MEKGTPHAAVEKRDVESWLLPRKSGEKVFQQGGIYICLGELQKGLGGNRYKGENKGLHGLANAPSNR